MPRRTRACEITGEEIKEYTFIEWVQQGFTTYTNLVLVGSMCNIVHQIRLNNGKLIYAIPESLYMQGITPPSIYFRGLQRMRQEQR